MKIAKRKKERAFTLIMYLTDYAFIKVKDT